IRPCERPSAVHSLWHSPASGQSFDQPDGWPLATTVPWGVRTFLPAFTERSPDHSDPDYTTQDGRPGAIVMMYRMRFILRSIRLITLTVSTILVVATIGFWINGQWYWNDFVCDWP